MSSLKYAQKQQIWRTCDIAIDCGANRFSQLPDRPYVHFKRIVTVGESDTLRNTTDSYEGGRLLNMIYVHFRATGADEAVQGLSELFSIRLQNDAVQNFDVR